MKQEVESLSWEEQVAEEFRSFSFGQNLVEMRNRMDEFHVYWLPPSRIPADLPLSLCSLLPNVWVWGHQPDKLYGLWAQAKQSQ